MISQLPARLTPCAVNMLARPEWFTQPSLIGQAKLAEAKGLARLLSSRALARQEIAAITLGDTIYFRSLDYYNPHSASGLALLAHELKHVEQYKQRGLFKFYAAYVWDYLRHGYGEMVRFEAEASDFQRQVQAHLEVELAANTGRQLCIELADPHSPNLAFIKTAPASFRFQPR